MAKYKLVFSENSKKDIKKLDKVTRQRIAKKLQFYGEQHNPLAHSRQLVHPKIGSHRFRVGHYRIVFDVDGQNINIISVKHRKDVYR